jgi:hypothetical protein
MLTDSPLSQASQLPHLIVVANETSACRLRQ